MCLGVKRGFPVGTSGKESACQRRRQRLNPWVRRILWRRWQSTPVFLPGKFHGQRSLTGYSPWGHKEADMSEPLSTHTGEKRGTAGREERKAGGDSRQLQMVLQRIRINCQLFCTTVLGYRSVSAEQPPTHSTATSSLTGFLGITRFLSLGQDTRGLSSGKSDRPLIKI